MTISPLAAQTPLHSAAITRSVLLFNETRSLLRLAIPIMLIAFVNMGMSVTDTLMVSASFGAEALAAVAVGSDFYSILFYLGAGTIGGLAPFYTAAIVKSDPDGRARLERTGQTIVLALAAFLVPILWTAPDWLGHLSLDQDLLAQGQGYTRAMALTLVPMLGVMLYRTILTAAERPKVFLKVTAAMLPLNAVGNFLFMNGFGPLPAFGPTGAGLSSLVVALISLGALIHIARRSAPAQTAARHKPRIGWNDLKPVLIVGVPIGIAMVTELGIFLAATLYAATLSAADVAAHTLTLRVAGVVYAIPAALGQASMVRMARATTGGDAAARRAVVFGSIGLALGAGTTLLLILSAVAAPLSHSFFDPSPVGLTTAGIASTLLLLLGAMEMVVAPGAAAAGLLRGRKDTRTPMVFTLFGYWVIGTPLGLWLCEVRDLGIEGIWIGLAAGTATTTALLLARLAIRPRPSLPGSAAPRSGQEAYRAPA